MQPVGWEQGFVGSSPEPTRGCLGGLEWVGVGGEMLLIEKNASSKRKRPEPAPESLAKHINICHL